MGSARRRTIGRRAAVVATAIAVVVGIGIAVRERDDPPADLTAIGADEMSSTTATAPSTSVVSTTTSIEPTTSSSAAAASDAGEPLWGKSFDAVAASDTRAPHELAPDTYVGFWTGPDHGNVYWSGGCNRLGAPVVVSSDQLNVADELQGSGVGCTEELNSKDAWMTDLLSSDPKWLLNGDRLTIMNDHARLELVVSQTRR